jgi:hypothetical protein
MGIQDRDSRAIEDLRRYGGSLVESVPTGQTEGMVTRGLAGRRRHQRSRRMVLVLATVGILAISNVGLAAVSDGASPGDFLYPLDRGYEWASDRFGPTDRTDERLAESEVLNNRGDIAQAISLLQEELGHPSSDPQLLVAAIKELQGQVDNGNQGQGLGPNLDPSSPAITAPGQVKDEMTEPSSPSDTAPGQVEDEVTPPSSPSDTAPGQIRDDAPGTDPPGQNKDARKTPGAETDSPRKNNGNNGS